MRSVYVFSLVGQAFALVDRWETITESQRQAIKAGNLLALLDEVRMGCPRK